MNKKNIRERLPEPKTIGKPLPIVTSSSPAIAKPNVVCSQSNVNLDIVSDVCNELSPILDELNNILSRYNLTKKEVSFHWTDNKITAFISCG